MLHFHSVFDLGNPSALSIADFMNDFNHFLDIQFLTFSITIFYVSSNGNSSVMLPVGSATSPEG
ncbi:MAG: hypothetical protein Q4G56_07365, partial [Bacillota bacterium]|nr:hypothetical protein [Bacillota bacterium]